jgi:hypothetical protein
MRRTGRYSYFSSLVARIIEGIISLTLSADNAGLRIDLWLAISCQKNLETLGFAATCIGPPRRRDSSVSRFSDPCDQMILTGAEIIDPPRCFQ